RKNVSSLFEVYFFHVIYFVCCSNISSRFNVDINCKLSCDVKVSFTNRESTLALMDITSIRLVALWIPFVKLPDRGCDSANFVTTSGLLYSFFQTVFERTVQHRERTIIPTMIKKIDLEVCWSPAFTKEIFS